MKGKNRCKILKDIRKRIAQENDIEYITTECKYKGDCLGTCPKCESEVRYLEAELEKRRSLGYKVTVAGLAAGITLASAGCDLNANTQLDGDVEITTSESALESSIDDNAVMGVPDESSVFTSLPDESEITGEIPPEESETMGEPIESMPPEVSDPYMDIMGDYAVFDYDLNEIAGLSDEEIFARLSVWNREFIDFGWKDYICRDIDHTVLTTVFMTDNGETLTVEYNEAGEVIAINGRYMVSIDDEK